MSQSFLILVRRIVVWIASSTKVSFGVFEDTDIGDKVLVLEPHRSDSYKFDQTE